MSAQTTPSTAAKAASLERKLNARPAAEKAFFDDGWVSFPMLLMVAFIGALELSANVRYGEGWSSLAHFVVIAPLEIIAVVILARGLRSLFWRWRLAVLRRAEKVSIAKTQLSYQPPL